MLFVFIKKHSLVSHFFDRLDLGRDVRIIRYPYDKHGRLCSLMRSIEAYLLWWLPHSWCYDDAYIAQLRGIRPEDSVLYFSMENRKTLQLLRKFVRARRQSVWLWDPVRSYRKSWLSRLVYELWLRHSGLDAYTFDPADAKALGIGLADQVFRHDPAPEDAAVARDIDLYCLASGKGRLPELVRWKALFESHGLRTHFHVVADDKGCSPPDARLLTSRWMSYADNLRLVRRSKCLLEILQGTQSGPTMRSLEALFHGCKLITSNALIVDCDFYHPSRVFIVGRDRPDDLRTFLATPLEPASAELLRKHELRSWLRQFDTPSTIQRAGVYAVSQ